MKLQNIPKHWIDRIAEDPNSEFAKKALRVQAKIDLHNGTETKLALKSQKSSIGTFLKQIFQSKVKALPCSRCKRMIEALNQMSLDEVRAERETLVHKIYLNSKETPLPFWTRLAAITDDKLTDGKGTKFMIGLWFDEACEQERKFLASKVWETEPNYIALKSHSGGEVFQIRKSAETGEVTFTGMCDEYSSLTVSNEDAIKILMQAIQFIETDQE